MKAILEGNQILFVQVKTINNKSAHKLQILMVTEMSLFPCFRVTVVEGFLRGPKKRKKGSMASKEHSGQTQERQCDASRLPDGKI